ncbi:MAG: DUF664 domain-containing protein [Streptosporangiaceae bacterium]
METSGDAYLFFVNRALDGMVAIVGELGDDLACTAPELPGANSPYVILHHCLAVMDYWGGHVVAGREVHRDRDEEFAASGPVARLISAAVAARCQFAEDMAAAEPAAPPRRPPLASTWAGPPPETQEHALLHILEELAQHHGQAQLTRDLHLPGAKTISARSRQSQSDWITAPAGRTTEPRRGSRDPAGRFFMIS